MDNLGGFVGLLLIWGLLYACYTVSVKRFQQGD